jgi:hypothetical protein
MRRPVVSFRPPCRHMVLQSSMCRQGSLKEKTRRRIQDNTQIAKKKLHHGERKYRRHKARRRVRVKTLTLNTEPFKNLGKGPRLYPMTGLQMNLSDFTSTPLNHAFMNSVLPARTPGPVPSNMCTSSLKRNACPLCVAKIWLLSWRSTIAPNKGQINSKRINDKTHPYNMHKHDFTSTKHISVSPLISLTTFLTFAE